jgi:hypothetical protein
MAAQHFTRTYPAVSARDMLLAPWHQDGMAEYRIGRRS